MLSGSTNVGGELKPEYIKIQFNKGQGSGFSYKIVTKKSTVSYP